MSAAGQPPQPPAPRRPKKETVAFLLEQVQGQIGLQEEQWSSLRTKATIVLGSAGVVFSRLLDTPLSPLGVRPGPWEHFGYPALATLLLIASLAALISLLPSKIRTDPNPRPFVERYLGRSPLRAQVQLLSNLIETYEYNQDVLRRVAVPLAVAVRALILALILFFVLAVGRWEEQWQKRRLVPQPAMSVPASSSSVFQSQTPPSSAMVRVSVPTESPAVRPRPGGAAGLSEKRSNPPPREQAKKPGSTSR